MWKWFIPLILLLAPTIASGHELRLERQPEGWLLLRGHAGHEAHGSPDAPCPAAQVGQWVLVEGNGALQRGSGAAADPALWPKDLQALWLAVSSGCWTKTPQGTLNVPRDQAQRPLASWLSRESLKHIEAWRPQLGRPLGTGFELTPLGDPLSLRPGDKLRILATADGNPVAGAVITYDGKPRGVTAADGTLNVKLRQGGRQSVGATWILPEPTERYDEIIHTTVLEFSLD